MRETMRSCTEVPHSESCDLIQRQERLRRSVRRATAMLEARALGLARWRGAGDAVAWYIGEWHRRTALPAARGERGSGYDPYRAETGERQYAAVVEAIGDAEKDDRRLHPDRPAPIEIWLTLHFVRDVDRRWIGKTFAWIAEWGPGDWSEREVASRVHRACRVIRKRLAAGGWLIGSGVEEAA